MKIATLTLEMAANVARLRQDMDAARKTVDSAMGGIAKAADFAKGALGGIAAGFSAGALIGKISSVQREFDVLNSSLITVTGSSARAAKEFAWIKEFAATTPFQLNEVTGAFVKMKALGLDASAKSLASYGNTASAMGKSLNQMIEAVADASTGEFERLKEFGIKANKEGDRVKLTFQGVSTSIGNNAQEITQYLQAIGNNQFAGAMSLRAQTLDGAISNLTDTWDALFRTISSQGAGGLIYDSVKLATGAVQDLTAIIDALSASTSKNAQDTGIMASVQNGLATVFETVAVMGVNLKYVLVSIGREIGGIAAQAAAVLSLDFSAAQAIGAAMREDAQRAREQVDATTTRILSARAIAKSLEGASALNEPRFARALEATAAAANKAKPAVSGLGAAAKKAADDFRSLLASLEQSIVAAKIEAQGFAGAQAEFLKLAASPEWAKFSNAQRAQVAALYESKIALEQADHATKALKKTQEEANKDYADSLKALKDSAQSVIERVQAMKDEAQATVLAEKLTISLAAATEMLTIKRLEEKQVQLLGNEAAVLAIQNEIKARRELLEQISGKDVAEKAAKLRDEQKTEWDKTWGQVAQSFTDALMQGGKSVSEYLKGLFRTLVLRPILEPLGKGFAGLLGGGGAGSALAGGGSNPLAGVFNPAGTPLGGGLGGLGGVLGGALGAFGTGLASGFGRILSAGIGGWASAAGSLIGTGAVSGVAAGLGMLAGPIGVAAALYKPLFGRKLKDSGIQGTFGGDDGFSGNTYQFYKGGLLRSDKTKLGALDEGTRSGLAGEFLSIRAQALAATEALGTTSSAVSGFTRDIKISFNGLNESQIAEKLQQVMAETQESMAELVLGTTAYNKQGESSAKAVQRLTSSLKAVNAVWTTLGFALKATSLAGADASSTLVDLLGGIEAFTATTSAYYTNFYTEAERQAKATQALTQQLSAMGLALPTSREAFRAMVEAAEQAGDDATLAALLKLQGAFHELQTGAERAAEIAQAAALKLVAQFTGASNSMTSVSNTALLLATNLGRADTAGDALTGSLQSIHVVLGDARSGVLTFGQTIGASVGSAALSPAQRAVASLRGEIDALSQRSGLTAANVNALGEALQAVDTASFTAAIVSLFESIAERLQGVFDGVMSERIAVREAAIGIVDPQTYSYNLLRSQIASQRVDLPSDAALRSANAALSVAAGNKDATDAALRNASATASQAAAALAAAQAAFSTTKSQIVAAEARENALFAQLGYAFQGGFVVDSNGRPSWVQGEANGQSWFNDTAEGQRGALSAMRGGSVWDWLAFQTTPGYNIRERYDPNAPWNLLTSLGSTYSSNLSAVNAASAASGRANTAVTTASSAANASNTRLTAAEAAQRTEAARYAAALTNYASAAATATSNLGRLREETVKYYQQQKDLADLMGQSAAALRTTVADYRFSQLGESAQYTQRLAQYDKAYALALSTTGEARANYANQMNAVLPQLLELAEATGNTNSIATLLARAEAVAKGLEDTLPRNYQAESLGLLADIDSSLAALGDGTQILVRAIDSGRDKTAEGLRAVVAALTGRSVPAFALGGSHTGGARIVGEFGPELEVTGPSRIYNASQTRSMLAGAGDSSAVVTELQSLRLEVAALRSESRAGDVAIATNTGKLARYADRWNDEGLPVINADSTALATVPA